MDWPLRHDERARGLARTAYETLEPFHVVAYFNPRSREAMGEAGLRAPAWYFGLRGAPLGDADPAVVAATFYNFSPDVVAQGWGQARLVGLGRVAALRDGMLDAVLRDCLGELVDDPELARVAVRLGAVVHELPLEGRALAAAWARCPRPDAPHLALWYSIAALREWRGDGHVAALALAGLRGVEALVLHEADHPDPTYQRRGLGREGSRRSRGWTEEDWAGAVDTLVGRGLLQAPGSAGEEVLTAEGGALYDRMEALTDDAAAGAWDGVEDAEGLIRSVRPFTKAVIDAGILPGTGRRGG